MELAHSSEGYPIPAFFPVNPVTELIYQSKDVAGYTWEIRRLRRYQFELIAIQESSFLTKLVL